MTTTLCLVTDRRRLAARLPAHDPEALPLQQIAAAIRAGIDLVQIREPDLDAGRLAALVAAAVTAAAGTTTRIVVNDRADVARACGAAGVHLRETSLPAGEARRLLGPGALIGRSIHRPDAVAQALPVDYLIAGTVFASDSKRAETPLLGIDGLAQTVRRARGVPVLAIGGITPSACAALARTGAAGIAAIGAFLPEPGDAAMLSVEKVVRSMRFAFDSAVELP